MKEKYIKQWTEQFSEQQNVRLEKRDKLEDLGQPAYGNHYKPDTKCKSLVEKYDHLAKDEIGETPSFKIAGRAMLVRSFGKAGFIQIDDGSCRFQIYVNKSTTAEEGFKSFKLLDSGDIVYAEGDIFKTNKGELSLNAKEFSIVTKALRPLPEKFHGLTDPELRYRMRYVDMIMNQESREKLKIRSQITQYIRQFFFDKDYIEAETPMLNSIAGGAAAKPFRTHHNALDMELFMKIAPELYLKRLVVGGFDKVFDMNRCFRNEGLSLKHNPEFTMVEFYQTYSTYEDMIELTQELLSGLVKKVHKSHVIKFGDREISFEAPFKRISLKNAAIEHSPLNEADFEDKDKLVETLKGKGHDPKDLNKLSLDKLTVLVFEEFAEEKLIQPTFITDYPKEISPLSRPNDENPNQVDRFELFINGWEVANAFSELNNPTDQLDRFADQAVLKDLGDEEACDVDYDYVRALEYGMPPTAGEGLGVDRLCMLLTDSSTIREVIAFPLLKKEQFFETQGDSQE